MHPEHLPLNDELAALLRAVHTQVAQREGAEHDSELCPVCTDERARHE